VNLQIEVLQRVGILFGVSYLLSVFVAHAVEIARKFSPKKADGTSRLDGWMVPLSALVFSGVIAVLILRPDTTRDQIYDTMTVAVFATLGAVGGDAWIRKVMGIFARGLGKPPEQPDPPRTRSEQPTTPDGRNR
jgi:uncharacterized BrkB/YihY/UPF0761 family membrane protein